MYNNSSGNNDNTAGICLAYASVPRQEYGETFNLENALLHGTLFPDLYKPLGVYGCENCTQTDKEDTHHG